MSHLETFGNDYAACRGKFLEAAGSAGARLQSYRNPEHGPGGEALFTDVALLGDKSADRVLLVCSGVHGVEGYAGSGIQISWLLSEASRALPKGVRVVLVHALNPFGFAWNRRVNEDNVDLNRNFFPPDSPRDNAGYLQLHSALEPDQWTEAAEGACLDALRRYADDHGDAVMMDALTGGQHSHPDGLFYAGQCPVWSNRLFAEILGTHLAGAGHVAFVDLHTGLGPYGHGELWHCGRPGSALERRLEAWYQAGLASPFRQDTVCVGATYGLIDYAVMDLLPSSQVTGVCMEFGTYDRDEFLLALCAENWLHHKGRRESPLGRAIEGRFRKAFFGQEPDWRALVTLRATQILERAVLGLIATSSNVGARDHERHC